MIVDQDGRPQQWAAVYMRHGRVYVRLCPSLADAYAYLRQGSDTDELSPGGVFDPECVLVMDQAEILDIDPDHAALLMRPLRLAAGHPQPEDSCPPEITQSRRFTSRAVTA